MNNFAFAAEINSLVNRSTTYMTDMQQYGVPEYWEPANKYGDCEDYALLKRVKLIESGFDPTALHLACCWVETGEYHCVLLAETDNGIFALDNRRSLPVPPSELPYKWHKAWQDGKWREISF